MKHEFTSTPESMGWFLLEEDRHEGPFSSEEIHARLILGQLKPEDQVWAEGMDCWAPIATVSALDPEKTRVTKQKGVENSRPLVSRSEPLPRKWNVSLDVKPIQGEPIVGLPISTTRSWLNRFRVAVFLSATALSVYLIYRKPEIPVIQEISVGDAENLREIASASARSGVQVGIALYREQIGKPIIYLSTNAPDGTAFELRVRAVPETLLSSVRFRHSERLTTDRALARSSELSLASGLPLPKGKYEIQVMDASGTVVGQREIFIGGENSAAHAADLKAFHEKLNLKSAAELFEFRQLLNSYDGQLRQTESAFQSAVQTETRSGSRRWANFSRGWLSYQDQLLQQISLSEKPNEEERPFHDLLHRDLSRLGQDLRSLHEAQSKALIQDGATDAEIRSLSEKASILASELLSLQMRLTQSERSQAQGQGMPWREEAP